MLNFLTFRDSRIFPLRRSRSPCHVPIRGPNPTHTTSGRNRFRRLLMSLHLTGDSIQRLRKMWCTMRARLSVPFAVLVKSQNMAQREESNYHRETAETSYYAIHSDKQAVQYSPKMWRLGFVNSPRPRGQRTPRRSITQPSLNLLAEYCTSLYGLDSRLRRLHTEATCVSKWRCSLYFLLSGQRERGGYYRSPSPPLLSSVLFIASALSILQKMSFAWLHPPRRQESWSGPVG